MSSLLNIFLFVFCISILLKQSESFLNVLFLRSNSKAVKVDPKPVPKGKQYVTINGTVYRQYPTPILPGSDIKTRYEIATSQEIQKLCNFKQIIKVKPYFYIISESGDTWFSPLQDYNTVCKSDNKFIYYISNNYNIVPSKSDKKKSCQKHSPTTTNAAESISEQGHKTAKPDNNRTLGTDKSTLTAESTTENVINTTKKDDVTITNTTTLFTTTEKDSKHSGTDRTDQLQTTYKIVDFLTTDQANDISTVPSVTEETTTENVIKTTKANNVSTTSTTMLFTTTEQNSEQPGTDRTDQLQTTNKIIEEIVNFSTTNQGKDISTVTAKTTTENIIDTAQTDDEHKTHDEYNSTVAEKITPTNEQTTLTPTTKESKFASLLPQNKTVTPVTTTKTTMKFTTTEKNDKHPGKGRIDKLQTGNQIIEEIVDILISDDLSTVPSVTAKTTPENGISIEEADDENETQEEDIIIAETEKTTSADKRTTVTPRIKESKAARSSKKTNTVTPATIPTTKETKSVTDSPTNTTNASMAETKKSTLANKQTTIIPSGTTTEKNKEQPGKGRIDKPQTNKKVISEVVDYW